MGEFFLPEDQKISDELGQLFEEWFRSLEKDNYFKKTGLSPDGFVVDGIFPGYSAQKIKILYIGRESWDLDGHHYIDKHLEWIKAGNFNGTHLNQKGVWRKLLKFTWGILHEASWEAIPAAADLAADFAEKGGFSFAIENVSKISRPWNGSTKADWGIIQGFVNASLATGKNFYGREAGIINPDLAISMNVVEKMDEAVFGDSLEYVKNPNPDVALFKLGINGKIIPLLDTWHFDARKKEEEMYENLRQAILESGISASGGQTIA